jgi:ornithine cyclodeaminase/alanine dehydrogenase-like protein (mu-crystallin family)
MQAFMAVRRIRKLQVYSPTRENREAFGREMAARYAIEVIPCDRPDDIYKGAGIVAALTDSAVPVLDGRRLEPGTHIVNVGGSGRLDAESLRRIDVYLRFGDAPAPVGHPEWTIDDQFLGWEARPASHKHGDGRRRERAHGIALPDKRITLGDIVSGTAAGRTSDEEITWSERGNLQGAQFYAVAARVYEAAKAAKVGYEIPTSLFLQDIRD